MKTNYKIALFLLLTTLVSNLWAQTKPNVVVIYTDDHRFTGIHALGNEAVRTPHIDKLTDTGVAFTNTYLMGAFTGATCMPSRAMLLTGKSLFHLKNLGRTIPEKDVTMPEAFHKAGYHSHIVGKWHQDRNSISRVFDSGGKVMGLGAYLVDHYRMPLWDWNKEGKFTKDNAYLLEYDDHQNIVKSPFTSKKYERGPIGTENNGPHTSEIFADEAISFITQYKEDNPFFMYVAFHAPHDPRQAPEKYKKMYPVSKINLPPSYLTQHPFDNGDMFIRDEKLAVWPRTEEVSKEQLSDYYAIITHLDEQIGRVIASLKKSGKYENTIIVLAGDSGLAVGNHGLMGKQNLYDEDGIHVPFIISGGAVTHKGKREDTFCYIHDIFPTVCEMAGVEIQSSVEGKSMMPVVNGTQKSVRDYTYHAYKQYQRAYRKGDFKLIEYVKAEGEWKGDKNVKGSRVTQLFNVKNDPWETQDLTIFPEYKEVLETMTAEMKKAAVSEGDNKEAIGYGFDFWDYYQTF
ncbi:sulfatase-like hydrolase/transferase [Limibacter armeniacum]|uniref:sulfatase-like hydrolase/transferase n=1 Tax=Limibacter armeniacum TaxID=466084 RepID=UPI002FE655F1